MIYNPRNEPKNVRLKKECCNKIYMEGFWNESDTNEKEWNVLMTRDSRKNLEYNSIPASK